MNIIKEHKFRKFIFLTQNLWQQVAALKKFQKEDLFAFYKKYIKAGAPDRTKLSIHVYGGAHEEEFKSLESEESSLSTKANATLGEETESKVNVYIKNIFKFKRTQSLYASLK